MKLLKKKSPIVIISVYIRIYGSTGCILKINGFFYFFINNINGFQYLYTILNNNNLSINLKMHD